MSLVTTSGITVGLVVMVTVLSLVAWKRRKYRAKDQKSLPPGPFCWPILGNIPQFINMSSINIHRTCAQLTAQYGDVVRVQMGGECMIILNNYEVIHDALIRHGDVTASRPTWLPTVQKFSKGKGLIWRNGHSRAILKKMCMKALKSTSIHTSSSNGNGGYSLETVVTAESRHLVMELDTLSVEGREFDPRVLITSAVNNVIACLCFGTRFSYNDEAFRRVITSMITTFKAFRLDIPEHFYPLLIHLPLPSSARRGLRSLTVLDDFIKEQFLLHDTPHTETRTGFVRVCLEREQTHKDLDRRDYLTTVRDLLMAGTETTASTIYWCLLYLLLYPEVQAKCQQNIDEVFGSDTHHPTIECRHRHQLVYMDAFILEVLRLSAVVPLSLPHAVEADITIAGYHIPQGSIILPNIYWIHRDPKYWDQPDEFLPDRWINKYGGIIKHKHFVPFSLGGRQCLGENLARMEVFLFLCNILHRYNVTTSLNQKQLQQRKQNCISGITLCPDSYTIRLASR